MSDIHNRMPQDNIKISTETYAELMQGQSDGKQISHDEQGNPTLVDYPSLTHEQVEKVRQQAYLEKADPLFFKYQAGEISKEEWLAARAEVEKAHPYPEEKPKTKTKTKPKDK